MSQGHHEHDADALRVAVLTVSSTRGANDDASGETAARILQEAGHRLTGRGLATDEVDAIGRQAMELLAEAQVLVVTGGTGLGPRDVTPEAFASLWERPWSGFGEEFRRRSQESVGLRGLLSRAIAGTVRGHDSVHLVYLLPGNPEAVAFGLKELVLPGLAHAWGMVRGPHG